MRPEFQRDQPIQAARMSNPAGRRGTVSESIPATAEPEERLPGAPASRPRAGTDEGRRFAPWRAALAQHLAPRSSPARYGLALVLAVAAYLVATLLETETG